MAVIVAAILVIAPMFGARQQSEKGAIEGLVVRAGTDQPVTGAQVILVPGNTNIEPWAGTARLTTATAPSRGLPSAVPDVTTDSNGRFLLERVVPGSYLLAVAAQGYSRQQYGQHPPSLRGRVLHISAGETRKDVKIPLTPTGVVIGRVLKSSGQAAPNILVELLRPAYDADGTRLLLSYLAAASNDRGEYRIFGAGPGRYYLFAGAAVNPDGSPYSPAAYPSGGVDVSRAVQVDVVAGAETTAAAWVMPSAKTFRVRGRVVDLQTGRPPARVVVQLFNVSESEIRSTTGVTSVSLQAYNAIDGGLAIDDISPGEYVLDVSAPASGIIGSAEEIQRRAQLAPRVRTLLRVRDRDIEGVVLTLAGGQIVEGRILLEGQNVSVVTNINGIRPQLRPSHDGRYLGGQRSPLVEHLELPGAFRIAGVHEGEYLVSVQGIPSGFYLRELRYGGKNLLSSPLQFSPASESSLEVVLRQGAAEVRGTVSNKLGDAMEGVIAVLVPADRHRLDLYKTVTTDRAGRFAIAEVVPGDYKVFSWEALSPNAHLNSDFLAAADTQGRAVRIAASSSIDVNVTMIPAK
jgi:hypothetical protein